MSERRILRLGSLKDVALWPWLGRALSKYSLCEFDQVL